MKESVARIEEPDGRVFEKVSLPGESLWVEVIEGPNMGTMTGKIANYPVGIGHTIKFGDVVRFGWVVRESYDGKAYGAWEPEA